MSIRVTKDGRTIREGAHYSDFRYMVWNLQAGRCIECSGPTDYYADLDRDYSFHLAHRGTRGMGSSFRDDVLGPKKGQVEGGKCGKHHRIEHNQQSAVQSQPQWSRR
jgi:hypothetical protein